MAVCELYVELCEAKVGSVLSVDVESESRRDKSSYFHLSLLQNWRDGESVSHPTMRSYFGPDK